MLQLAKSSSKTPNNKLIDVLFSFLKEGNAKAVEILFTYYHKELKSKQLDVLSNIFESKTQFINFLILK